MDLLKIYFMNIKFPLNPINRSRDGNKIFGISTILIGQSKKYLSRILGLYFKQIMINNILDLLTLQEGGAFEAPPTQNRQFKHLLVIQLSRKNLTFPRTL